MPKMIFVNLPVKDLGAATRFYEAIGCEKNAQFSDEKASSMVWSDTIVFQLLTRDYYATFTQKPIADAHGTSAALFALSFDSREQVDAVVAAAATAGGKADVREPQDLGFMYSRAFADPDGNVFEPMWMDPSAISGDGAPSA
ncbi:VOC family protein [Chelatococcus reniformis]|uniref:Glyoxalase n=1 Tax=Chelatococcus reniformis TaxID=1494448 RepID=A0A916XJR7_9HYPH|nr:VOC family protein [Chelatococcus reniformis]GGC78898.1 glyoxalase [Chelatococcus reniformis]